MASARTRVGEKLAETEEDLLRHRTDGTDAFDTLYIGCAKFPPNTNFRLNFTGVIVSEATIKRAIQKLIDKKLVQRKGSNKTGLWEIIDNNQ